jgi:hypothetical protein
VTFVVQSTPSGPARHLCVLATRQEIAAAITELGESLKYHCTSGHIDTESESFGGEHDPEETRFKTPLHDFAERGHHPGVVCRESETETFEEVGKFQGSKIVVAEFRDASVRNAFDLSNVVARCESQSVSTAVIDGLITRGSGEDEENAR